MIKRYLFFFSITLMLVTLLICGCSTPTPTATPLPTPSPTPQATPEPTPDPALKITDFTVIYPAGKIFPSAQLVDAASRITSYIEDKTDVTTYAETDKSSEYEYEILIGTTTRAESSSVYNDELKYYDYTITSIGKKLVICGGSDEAVSNAVDHFINNMIKGDLTVDGSGLQLLDMSYEHKTDFPYESFYIDGTYIGNFTLSSNCDASIKDNFISRLLEITGEQISVGSSEHQIIIGESTASEYTQIVKNKRPGDYFVAVSNGKLIIDGGNASDLKTAINYFFSTYLPTTATTSEINEENHMIYYHPYRYDTVTVNGKSLSEYTVMINISKELSYPSNPNYDSNATIFVQAFADNVAYWTGVTPDFLPSYQSTKPNSIIFEVGNFPECSKLNDREFVARVENGNIIISTPSYNGLKSAISGFADSVLGSDKVVNLTDGMTFDGKFPHPVDSITLCGKDISEYVIVTNDDHLLTAKLLAKKIAEMCGVKLKIKTDSADNYECAIILSKSDDNRAKQLLALIEENNVLAISEGTKIYLGTNSTSYGDTPAVNAFIRNILGYDTILGKAKEQNIVVDSINKDLLIDDYVQNYTITHYCGINMDWLFNEDGTFNPYRIDEAKAAGFNLLPIGFLPMEKMRVVLDYCHEVGVYCLVHDSRLDSLAHCARNDLPMPKNWMEMIDEVVADYSEHPAVKAYNVTDEPPPSAFHNLYQVCSYLEYKDPSRYQYVNNSCVIWQNDMDKGNSFYNYVLQNGLEFFSYDLYTFITEDSIVHASADDGRIEFLSSLYIGRLTGLEHDVETMKIVLLIEHRWGEGSDGYTSFRKLNESELRWEAMSVLAYGYSALSYFTYRSPGEYDTSGGTYWGDAIIKYNGEKSEYYDYVSGINADVAKLGRILYGKHSKEVFYLGELKYLDRVSQTVIDQQSISFNKFEGYNTISSITYDNELPTGGLVPVSFFEDDMMMIVNDYTNSRTFTINTQSDLLIYDVNVDEWVECDGSITLNAGDGALLKIVK